jgi:hypothetical protein
MALADLVYIYGVGRYPSAAVTLPLGLEQATQLFRVDDLAAIVEYGIDLTALQADDQRLLTAVLSHDRVICDLFQQMTILPIRFGTQLASLDRLKAHIGSQYQSYQDKLTELDHKSEYQLKLVPEAIAPSPPAENLSGRDYFLAKKQRLQDHSMAQAQQQAELVSLCDRIRQTFPGAVNASHDDGTAKVYILLASEEAQTLRQQATRWQAETVYWHLTLSQALPPYHFV